MSVSTSLSIHNIYIIRYSHKSPISILLDIHINLQKVRACLVPAHLNSVFYTQKQNIAGPTTKFFVWHFYSVFVFKSKYCLTDTRFCLKKKNLFQLSLSLSLLSHRRSSWCPSRVPISLAIPPLGGNRSGHMGFTVLLRNKLRVLPI